jgi:ATP-dependent Lon protease
MAQSLPHYQPESGLLPLLPLRDVVVYPHLVIPLFVGRAKSVKALELASEGNKQILLVAQKSASKDDPDASDLHEVGTVATVLQMLKLPDGTVKVLVEGLQRAKISGFVETEECFAALPELITDAASDVEIQALMRTVFAQFDQYVKLNKKIPPEILTSLVRSI